MPWTIPTTVGERWCLVKALLRNEQSVTRWCQIYGISRKTAYKWKARFLTGGRRALRDQSRRPRRGPGQILRRWRKRIRWLRQKQRSWGPKKIRVYFLRQGGRPPSVRTIGRWLKGWKMIPPLRRRPRQACVRLRPQLTVARRPNQVWTVDFKGWFRTGNGQRCEPLTVRDLFSRYGLAARVLPSPHVAPAQVVFRGLFQQHGLPEVIRMDNGNPFGSTGPAGLSRLSVWWLRLGIRVEYIRPACPQDNGAHEQFHGVMKRETTEPAAATRRGQQHRTTVWLEHYNRQRPHEGLAQAEPVTKYRKSRRKFPRHLPEIKYGPNHAPRRVRSNGQIRWAGRKRFVGEAFVGQIVGVRVLRKGVVAVYFSKHLLGHLHERDQGPMRPAHYRHRRPKRKKSKVLPMSWPRAHPSLLPSEEGEIAGRFDGGNHGTGDVIRPESQIHQVHGKRGSEPDWLSTSIREWARWPGTDKRSPHFILI